MDQSRLSHYTLGAALGAGGMGVVYRATDTRLNRTVALKVIAPDAIADRDRKLRFLREARAASALSHPNIVTIHDIGDADGVDFLVMELVSGRSLDQLIPKEGMPVERAIDIAIQITSALDAAHTADIIHRDIKPANIMITDAGQVKVLDFGLAKRLDGLPDQNLTTVAPTLATEAGMVLGTMAYMSPEQAQGLPVDGRTDIFSFGALLYEMLTGRRAFSGATSMSTLAAILSEQPPPIETIRKDLSPGLLQLVHDCLQKNRTARPSARGALDRLIALQRSATATSVDLRRLVRRPAIVIPAAAALLLIAAGGAWRWQSTSRLRWARTVAIPEIQASMDRAEYDGAYRLARQAMALLPDDVHLAQMWLDLTGGASVDTSPPGADVSVKGYLADAADWIPIGRTPLTTVRVPLGALRVRLSKEGFAPIETEGAILLNYNLDPPAAVVPGMVHVSSVTAVVGPTSMALQEFWIDKFEVTNREFKAFVDKGGYKSRDYWKVPFVDGGRTLSWEEAMEIFRDKTGRPGPSTWELGSFPDGQSEMPVSGVSWYEAAAYAAFAGKQVPTAFHWRAAGGFNTPIENFADILLVSNFSGKGPVPVGSTKGLGPWGTYDMAGNVKEWCWNEGPEGKHYILGAGWNESSFNFHDLDAQPPFQRSESYGLRLMKEIEPSAPEARAAIPSTMRDFTKEVPVDDATFEVIRGLYAYDNTPLNATIDQTDDVPAWRKETVSYDAPYGKERIRAYLYLPKNVSPPYQTVMYFPGGDAPLLRSSRDLNLRNVDFVIRSGRALLYPVYKGTYERNVQVTGANDMRDLAIARAKDARRSIDYLISRTDVDKDRLAFFGMSLGASVGIRITAVEPRLKASVLMGAGMLATRFPPEMEHLNFAPRIRVPTLLVNGRSDFTYQYETSQLPLFRLLGPPADQKELATFEGGHIPMQMHDVIRRILDWFDKYLGPVAT
jgi:dienelactone hydrolase